jgi:hypothetical protein
MPHRSCRSRRPGRLIRDKAWSDADARHREELSNSTLELLRQNTELTQQVADLSRQLTEEIHEHVLAGGPASPASN